MTLGSSMDIVIPTLNEERNLPRLLTSLAASSVPPQGIWVVDGGSHDGTKQVVSQFGANFVALTKTPTTQGDARGYTGYAAARNYRLERTASDWILFLDADMEMSPPTLQEIQTLLSGGTDAIAIPEVTLGDTYLARVRHWERLAELPGRLNEAPRAFSVSALRTVGGYRTDMAGFEDLELRTRLERSGFSIVTTQNVLYHHEGELSLRSYVRKRSQYARGAALLLELHPDFARGLLSLRTRLVALLLHFMEDPHPTLLIGALILKGGEGLLVLGQAGNYVCSMTTEMGAITEGRQAHTEDIDSPASWPSVSFIIATYNNSATVRDCLASIRFQDYPPELVEVVVADGGSTDATIEICEQSGAKVLHNPARSEKGFEGGKSVALRGAQHEVVILLDADNVLGSPDYIREVVTPLRESPQAVAVSPIITADPRWRSFERYAAYVYDPFDFGWSPTCEERTLLGQKSERYMELHCLPREKVYVGNGTAVRRGVLLTVGGYDFDLETGKRVYRQGKMLLSTHAGIYHHNASSVRQLVSKRVRQARDLAAFAPRRMSEEGFSNLVLPKTRSDLARLELQVLGNLSIAHPFLVGLRETLRRKDPAMLWHCIMAPLVTISYFSTLWSDARGRALLVSLLSDGAKSLTGARRDPE